MKNIAMICNIKNKSQKQHWLKVLETGSYYKITLSYNGK